jgi:hypothetical protein
MAGITVKAGTVDDINPPIIGTAIRCITSEPVPVYQRIGTKAVRTSQNDAAPLRERLGDTMTTNLPAQIGPFLSTQH